MIVGDKIRLKKQMGVFDNIGEICEVKEIYEGGVICFSFGEGKHLGCMSYDECEKYFEKIVEPTKRKWTKWIEGHCFICDPLFGNTECIDVEYRNNGKIVEVRKVLDKKAIKTKATCCNNDKFSFLTGYKLAVKRFAVEYLRNKADEFAKVCD